MKIQAFMSQEERIRYVRGADDLAFAIKEGGANSETVSQRFKQFFHEALTELKLESTSLELVRGLSKPCSALVLGVQISIRPEGNLEIRAIINRFQKKLNQSIDSDIRKIQSKSIMHFERALLPRIFH